MNEKIEKLAIEAGLYAFVSDKGIDPDITKFAELIIKECAEIARVFSVEGVEYHGGDAIREHFGVEE